MAIVTNNWANEPVAPRKFAGETSVKYIGANPLFNPKIFLILKI